MPAATYTELQPSGSSSRHAVIAGGGIGGMAAALALLRTGWKVTVFERAGEIAEVGAGLQLSPNANRALGLLGVLERIAKTGFRPEAAEMLDGRSGAMIFRTTLGTAAEARWGAPYLHIHRADLLVALTDAALEHGLKLRTGASVEGWEDAGGRVTVHLDGGVPVSADILVAADGVRSGLREAMHGPAPVRFTGQIAWRATIPAADLPDGLVAPRATVWVGPGRHLVTYFLRGGRLVNLVAVEERDEWTEENWSLPGDVGHLRSMFAGWHARVTNLLEHVKAPLKWGLFDRPAPLSWVSGYVTLLGDSCHPMLPFMAQGAAMAIEDAVTLAEVLRTGEVPGALVRYERLRRPRTTRVQALSRANGRLFHHDTTFSRLACQGPVALVSRIAPGLAAGRLDWLYGHDAARVAMGEH